MPAAADRREVQRLARDEGAVIVEVLPKPEYDWAHLPGAVHLPLKGWDPDEITATVGTDRPVIVYCHDLQ